MPRRYSRKIILKLPWTRLPPDIVQWIIWRASEFRGLAPRWNAFQISRSLMRNRRFYVSRDGIKWVLRTHAPDVLKKRADAFKKIAALNRTKKCPGCRRSWTKEERNFALSLSPGLTPSGGMRSPAGGQASLSGSSEMEMFTASNSQEDCQIGYN